MKVTPRIEFLEEIIDGGIGGSHGGINYLRRQHYDMPTDVYLTMVNGMITTLTDTVIFLKELEEEVKS